MQINRPQWQSDGHIEIAKYIELCSRKNFKNDRWCRIAGELIQSSLPLAILSLTREKNSFRSSQSSYCFLSWDLCRICIKIATCKEDKGKLKSNPLRKLGLCFPRRLIPHAVVRATGVIFEKAPLEHDEKKGAFRISEEDAGNGVIFNDYDNDDDDDDGEG